jgi:hypothetical protein
VELLWQLSALALREVHQRVFPADVAANPLPAPLTEIMLENSHPTALLGVTKVTQKTSTFLKRKKWFASEWKRNTLLRFSMPTSSETCVSSLGLDHHPLRFVVELNTHCCKF